MRMRDIHVINTRETFERLNQWWCSVCSQPHQPTLIVDCFMGRERLEDERAKYSVRVRTGLTGALTAVITARLHIFEHWNLGHVIRDVSVNYRYWNFMCVPGGTVPLTKKGYENYMKSEQLCSGFIGTYSYERTSCSHDHHESKSCSPCSCIDILTHSVNLRKYRGHISRTLFFIQILLLIFFLGIQRYRYSCHDPPCSILVPSTDIESTQ